MERLYRVRNMLARHTKMMQLLLFYCIVIQSCVLRDVESIPTPTESSAESEIPGETVGRSGRSSEITETSLLGFVNELFKTFTSIVLHIPSLRCVVETGNFLNYVLRGKRDTTNEQTVIDIELNPNAYDGVLRAADKRDRKELKKVIKLTIDYLNDLIFSKIPLLIAKFDSKDNLHTGPKEIKSVAFENGESTIRNK